MVEIDIEEPLLKPETLYKEEKKIYNQNPNLPKLLYKEDDMIPVCPKSDCNKPVYYKSYSKKDQTVPQLWRCYHCNNWFEKPAFRKRNQQYWGNRTQAIKKIELHDRHCIKNKELIKQIRGLEKLKSKDGKALIPFKKVLTVQAFIAFLYLTAARVEEVVGMRDQKTREMVYPPIIRKQISFEYIDEQECMIVTAMPVFKRKMQNNEVPTRSCVVVVRDEPELIKIIKDYLNLKIKYDDMALFASNYRGFAEEKSPTITYQTAGNWCKFITFPLNNLDEKSTRRPAFNHYFRHLRISHLAQLYGMNDTELRNYVGWSSSAMAAKYAHLGINEMAKRMIYQKRRQER